MHWAGFLVVGASTRLPQGGNGSRAAPTSAGGRKSIHDLSVAEVCELVRGIGFASAADVLQENGVDGKTLAAPGFEELMGLSVVEGGLGLKPMQKIRLKKEIEVRW